MNMQIDLEKGIANVGDVSRMKEVMARADAGERLVIGFIGGSITQGSLSTTPQTCYAYRVYTWWKETFPQAEFAYCNAGNRRHDIGVRRGACRDRSSGGETRLCDCGIFCQ